jgi:asparagine synthase (glutamine-hydrolysing)
MSSPVPHVGMRSALPVVGGLMTSSGGQMASAALRAMARRVTREDVRICAGDEAAGFFAIGGTLLERSGRVWLEGDVDLVNLDDLRAVTGCGGSVGAVLSRLYEMEGADCFRRLRGAFSIALWDGRVRQLLLAVDHFGMRRLYYSGGATVTAFASRIAPLLAAPGLAPAIEPIEVYNYLNFGFVPAPGTPFRGIHRLPPGHVMRVRQGYRKVEPFWDVKYTEKPQREADAAASIFDLSQEAVREACGRGTLKGTGAFLSGGTDSSTVVGLMGRVTGEPVTCFSIGFREDRYDEGRYAALTARHFGAIHHTRVVNADDAFEAVPELVDAYDEPLGNNSAIGTLMCARMAREHGIIRLLAGDGGDEIFGGNERYRTDRIFARYGAVPAVIRKKVLEPLLLGRPGTAPGLVGRAQRYIRRATIPNPARFYSYEFHVAQNAQTLLEPDFLQQVGSGGPGKVLDDHFRRVEASSELDRLLYLDLKLTIGDNDLFKVTRTAEMAGVGVRFPFLALPLVEFTSTLPSRFKLRGLEKRYLFKRAFRGLLPGETLAKRKHGFGVPTAEWLRTHSGFREMARDTLLSQRAAQRGYFRRGALERLFEEHAGDSTAFYGDIIWAVLMLELWHRRHVDQAETA